MIGVSPLEYLERCLTRRKEGGRRRDPGFADFPDFPAERIRELSGNDLLHMLFGVATRGAIHEPNMEAED